MRLYIGTSRNFIEDNIQNQIAGKLRQSFFDYFRYDPSENEVRSWKNSLRAMALVLEAGKLYDQGIILEYQLPLTSKRLDCLVCGQDYGKKNNAVIVELKQWDKCKTYDGERVITWVGGSNKEVLHPSIQVRQYHQYLQDLHTAFHGGSNPVRLSSCVYLHNYEFCQKDPLLADPFKPVFNSYPLFSSDDVPKLKDYLVKRIGNGAGDKVLDQVEKSKYRPSKKLLDHVGGLIKGDPEYILLDEQRVVYDKVLSTLKEGFHKRKKTVLIVKGGPGTGKSVIAINLMADSLLQGYNAHYATGSKAFTETLRKKIGFRGAPQFKYFNSYKEARPNEIDLLICDESHRIRETSNNRFTPRSKRSGFPQIQELLSAGRVMVFFIDDDQVVRPNEIGSSKYIREQARRYNCEIHEYELEAQFRCNGSAAFVNWVNNTLGIKRTANVIWDRHEEFEFKIFDSPHSLRESIREKNKQKPNSARLAASYCWPWSAPRHDGTLVHDVQIGDFSMPWEKKDRFWEWAHEDSGMDQMGTVYTAQGFEFDYIGVIFSPDLTYSLDKQAWEGHPEKSCDTMVRRSKEQFTTMIKNVYRVLLSRGMRGCYVYFTDKDTERFFKSRIET